MGGTSVDEEYNQYLQQRSLFSKFYRSLFLYPKLNSYITGNVLDFGCGIGDFLRFRPATIGVDNNCFNIEFCRSQGLKADLLSDTGGIPFENESFNSIVMDNVIEHISSEDIDQVLVEILRVLRPGGRFLIGIPGMKGFNSDSSHKCFYSEQGLVDLLSRYGWERQKSFHMPIFVPWLEKHFSQYCIYVLFVSHAGNSHLPSSSRVP
jgi:SAM-dependent methyltransferase